MLATLSPLDVSRRGPGFMTFTMSSEGDSAKSPMLEPGDEKSGAEQTTDSSQDATDKPTENHEEKPPEKGAEAPVEATKPDQKDEKKKEEPKEPEAKPKSDDDDEDSGASKGDAATPEKKDDDKAGKDKTEDDAEVKDEKEKKGGKDEDDAGEKEVPLLDQPLEQKGKRERKNVQRFNEESTEHKDNVKVDVIPGGGTSLGDIPRVDASISRFKNDDLKLLHRLLFKSMGKTVLIKKNIRKFNGFDFKKDSEEYTKKVNAAHKLEVKNLKSICEMLDLQKSGTKDEIINRVMDFLMEPKDSGRQVDGGRPKRTAAVRANNRGYSSHDDYSSDDRATSRARRDKGKRSNLKDDSSSDEDFQPNQSDASDDRSHTAKRKRRSQRKKSSDDESEASVATSDESDDEPKSKRKRSPVKVNNRSKPKGTGRRGRPPASTKRAPTRPKKKAPSSDEESDKKDEGSSSEDEPLAKKAKSSQPPTDDEIKTFIKSILEGANLEEITMKTVCQRVYSNYPDFDLTHKKYFIKSTVKSLIST